MTDDNKPQDGEERQESQEEATEDMEPSNADVSDEVQTLKEQLAANHERLLRTAADLDNLRKRSKRDVEDALIRGRTEVLTEILPVIDSVDLALTSADPAGNAASIIEGVKMIQKQFHTATERFQLKVVETEGQGFDPNFHEAVAQLASPDHPAGQIVNEMRKGYLLGDRLLRPAMVVVSKGESPAKMTPGTAEADTAEEREASGASPKNEDAPSGIDKGDPPSDDTADNTDETPDAQ